MKPRLSFYSVRRIVSVLLVIAVLGTSLLTPFGRHRIGLTVAHAAPYDSRALSLIGATALAAELDGRANGELRSSAASDLVQGVSAILDEPVGMLFDQGVVQAAPEQSPAALANPITVSRVQSAYHTADTISETLVVTFTVINNRPATLFPNIPVSATITDTLAVLSGFDSAQDPNTVRDVILADSIATGASLLGAQPAPDISGTELIWNLGDVPPMSVATATLVLEVPDAVNVITNLDAGAVAHGALQGRLVSATTRPATLAPDSFGVYLRWTPDADIFDEYMLKRAAEYHMDPILAFEFVRSLGYESYAGSMRGTRGTLWSKAGNSLDQASLLVAMLRASGVPARYARGTLGTQLSQDLIHSMFPEPTQVSGHIPPGAEVSDPAGDPQLIAETQDHWWVQAYLNGAWVDLDPSFAQAQPGDSFAAVAELWDEVPDALRHKVSLSLKIEQLVSFSALTGNFDVSRPLSITLNTVELTGKPVTLGHLVNTTVLGGVFSSVEHTYTPYIVVGNSNQFIEGSPYQDLLTNFPFGYAFTTGAWLAVEVFDADGLVESYEHEIVDLLGFDARQGTTNIQVDLERGTDPLLTPIDLYSVMVVASRIPSTSKGPAILEQVQIASEWNAVADSTDPDAEVRRILLSAEATRSLLKNVGLMHHATSDEMEAFLANAFLVKSYHSAADVSIVFHKLQLPEQEGDATPLTVGIDLVRTRPRALAYPNQSPDGGFLFNMVAGMQRKAVEDSVMARLIPASPDGELEFIRQTGVIQVFSAADAQGIPSITVMDHADLAQLAISPEAKARISTALERDRVVIVPGEMVDLDGELTLAWWEVDPETGETVGVNEDGMHMSDVEYAFFALGAFVFSGFTSFVSTYFFLLGEHLGLVFAGVDPQDAADTMKRVIAAFSWDEVWVVFEVGLCAASATFIGAIESVFGAIITGACVGFGAALRLYSSLLERGGYDPALPKYLIQNERHLEPDPIDPGASATVFWQQSTTDDQIDVNVLTAHTSLTGTLQARWNPLAQQGFNATVLSSANATVFDERGLLLGGGAVASVPLASVMELSAQGSSLFSTVSGVGHHDFYPQPGSGLGVGNKWHAYTALLTSTVPYTLELRDARLTLNGTNSFEGAFTVIANGDSLVAGEGSTAAPNFADHAVVGATEGRLLVSPVGGQVLVNGQPLDVTNGVAIAEYDGTVAITDVTSTTDSVNLAGTVPFFTLNIVPASTTSDPVTPVEFQSEVFANFSDSYTTTVAGPPGWQVSVGATGLVTLTPPSGAKPDEYTALVTVQSSQYPDLYLYGLHKITITPHQGMALSVNEDLRISVPMGDVMNPNWVAPGIGGHIDNGRAEIPKAAYTINITNTSTISHPFDVSVTGLPGGWPVLSGGDGAPVRSVAVPAGGVGQVGLYISPTQATLLAPGTSYPFQVTATATDGSGLSATENLVFTMPAVAFPYPRVTPTMEYVVPDRTVEFTLDIINVGNAPGAFVVTTTVPSLIYGSDPFSSTRSLTVTPALFTSPVLAPDQSHVQILTVDTAGATVGENYLLSSHSIAGEYRPTAYAVIQIVSAITGPIFEAADRTAKVCMLGEPGLSAALKTLALAMLKLEKACANGDCRLPLRDNVVDATYSVATYAGGVSSLVTVDTTLRSLAQQLGTHTANTDILADLTAISGAVQTLETEICELSEHLPRVRWVPGYDAGLVGQAVNYTLDVTNRGTVTTTYAITVDLPTGTFNLNPTINPGATTSTGFPVNPGALGVYPLRADVTAVGADVQLADLTVSANAALNVVDRFIQLTAVTPDPAFVETGVSSSTLSIDVSNVANVARDATAHLEILAPSGGISYTTDLSTTILVGTPRTYELATVDTSGWTEGVYTVTVDLMDNVQAVIPDGSGTGYLAIGQALGASHSVGPALVAPGTVTVTTVITTEILAETIAPPVAAPAAEWKPTGLRQVPPQDGALATADDQDHQAGEALAAEPAGAPITLRNRPLTTNAITRTEDTDPSVTYTGTWTTVANSSSWRASNGDYTWSNTTGDVASYDFSGTWVAVGFATVNFAGEAEIFVDGTSLGVVDLYTRYNDVRRYVFDGLPDASHTISVTVLGTRNPYATRSDVILDYIDTWDGTAMPGGLFEQDDPRVWLSADWVNVADPVASGGSYMRDGTGQQSTAWFPFTGDSITFQVIARSDGDKITIHIDETMMGSYDLFSFTAVTRTFSFDGLGAGPHVMTVRHYRGEPNVDAFYVPAIGPADPPTIGSFHRYEEYHPALLYNGVPLAVTAQTWAVLADVRASDNYATYSSSAGDSVSLTFSGTTVGIGLLAGISGGGNNGGEAEISIDGVSQGTVDLYRRDRDVVSLYYAGLANGSHTVTVTALGTKHPNSIDTRVALDYIDVWDGTPLPDGVFEEDDDRVYRSSAWSRVTDAVASGGAYFQDGITADATAWFPFNGDSVSYHAIANNQGSQFNKVYVDGVLMGVVNLYSPNVVTRTFSFDNLGSGVHVLQLQKYRGELTVDAFSTPGDPPFYQPPSYTGILRYEEDHPNLLYNGESYAQRPSSWTIQGASEVSGDFASLSSTANDTVSLTFDGQWVSVGFLTMQSGGQAEVFLDGVSQETVGLYSPVNDVTSVVYGGLVSGTHTIMVKVLGLPDPPSTQARVHVDYIDVWDGTAMPDDVSNADLASHDGRIHFTSRLGMAIDPNAIEGDFTQIALGIGPANVWYAFTGDAFTFYAFTRSTGGVAEVYVDGVHVDSADIGYPFLQQPLAFHYTGLGDGSHVARINNGGNFRVDAFAANPAQLTPYQPIAEWYDNASGGASIWGGVVTPIAAGDVTGDGETEIVVASSNIANSGELFLFRGDGQDTGDGDAIIWRVPFNIFNGFEDVGSPAIAELDGQAGAEIVLATVEGLYAFHSDGSQYWFTDTLKPHVFFGTPAIANLDFEPLPEIVINMENVLAVFEADGTIAWQTPFVATHMPVLADLTGDGLLDILVDDSTTLYLYDYNLGSPQLEWSVPFTTTIHAYGSMAVADIDGQQPGGDTGPEIAIAGEQILTVLDADSTVVWTARVDPGQTGGVTIADLDGDGEVELVTTSLFGGGYIYAFNADGSTLWTAPALDSSPMNVSAADLDGDGAYEVLWNGVNQGFTIYSGFDGSVLFNEPTVTSKTGSDFPTVADVDGDGYAEVLVAAQGGLRVFGYDGGWGPARSEWNQLTYHITNINDDLTVPFSEPNSWELHNTFRTQTPLPSPLPVYAVSVSHTVGISGVTVLMNSFSTPPTVATHPLYGWDYTQDWTQPVVTRTFDSVISNLRPGETRLVAQGTDVAYTLPSGRNRLVLPPLYVSARHIVDVTPDLQTVGGGGTAVYSVTLTNPGTVADTYRLDVAGLPVEWATLPTSVTLPAGAALTLPLSVTIPAGTDLGENPFIVTVINSAGGMDHAGASLAVIDALEVSLAPTARTAQAGVPVSYTLTISNLEATDRIYDLYPTGLADVVLPPTTGVAANSAWSLVVTATAYSEGPHPFTVNVVGDSASASADAVLDAVGSFGVGLALSPPTSFGGPGTPAVMTATVTNLGGLYDTYSLTLSAPAGWSYEFLANGTPVITVGLLPHVFNAVDLRLLVTPGVAATAGVYDISVSAQSHTDPHTWATVTGTVEVLPLGVQVAVSPETSVIDPANTGVWQVTVTNTGSVADSYVLSAAGIVALSAQFTPNSVSLPPGGSQNVQLAANDLSFALPGTYEFAVIAASQSDSRIVNEDRAHLTLTGYEAAAMAWLPETQTVTDTLSATFMLLVTNTGNIATVYQFDLSMPGLSGQLPVSELTVPAHLVAALPLRVKAAAGGTYTIDATATSESANVSVSESASLIVVFDNQPPVVDAGSDQNADEGSPVSFSGVATDPEGGVLSILWDLGDGSTSTGSLSPIHAYGDDGAYRVTVVVTDAGGLSASDVLTVTVDNVAPSVAAGSDTMAFAGEPTSLNGSFTDPGALDSHTIAWDFGDGAPDSGTLTPNHVFAAIGVYTVTLTVTDDDGGVGSDALRVTVVEKGKILYFPIIVN